jgi:hypothetical protein
VRNWLDVIVDWAERRRLPLWVQFLIFWGAEALLFNGVQWLVGNTNESQHLQVTFDSAYLPFLLFFYALARDRARLAYERFRPALGESGGGAGGAVAFARFGAIPVAVWTFAGAAFGIAGLLDPEVSGLRMSGSLAEYIVLGGIGGGAGFGVLAVAGAYIVLLVVRIARIHRRAGNIDPFHPAPARAFARVTALLAALFVISTAYSALTDSTTWTNSTNRAVAIGQLVLAVIVFIAPLLGMSAKLRDAKEVLLAANQTRLRSTAARIQAAIDAGRDELVAPMNASVEALLAERSEIRATSTWPWDLRTVRGVATTLLLPLATWGITQGISRLLNL